MSRRRRKIYQAASRDVANALKTARSTLERPARWGQRVRPWQL